MTAPLPVLAAPPELRACPGHIHLTLTLSQPGTPYTGTITMKFYPGPTGPPPAAVAAGLITITAMFLDRTEEEPR